MKIIALIAAGLLSTVAAVVPASAQMQERHNTRVVTRTVVHTEGRRAGWRNHHRRQVCTNRWRHGHRVRVCRTVRY